MTLNVFGCRPVLLFASELCSILLHISFWSSITAGGKVCLGLDVGSCYATIALAGVLNVMMCAWLEQEALKRGQLRDVKNIGCWKYQFMLLLPRLFNDPVSPL